MVISMAGFSFNDGLMKFAMLELNLFQSIFVRGLFACCLMALLCWYVGDFKAAKQPFQSLLHRNLLLRTVGELGGTFFFLSALFHMPIANVTAVLQVLPLALTFAGALFLGETVGWRRYLAIGVGFFGVMLIIRPGTGDFNVFAIYALIATAFITLRDLATRGLPPNIPSTFVSLVTSICVLGLGFVGMQFEVWQPMGLRQISLLAGAAAILMVGYLFSVMAMRNGEIAFVSPFRYSILLWALMLGYFLFGDVPDFWACVGAIIVILSGLFTFYRERLSARNLATSADSDAASAINH